MYFFTPGWEDHQVLAYSLLIAVCAEAGRNGDLLPITITPWTQFPPETWCLSGLWYHLYLNILTAATFRWFLAIYCTSRVRGIQDPMQVRGVSSSGDFPLQKTGLGLPSMHCCICYISCPSTVIVRWLQQCYTTNKCRFCSRIKTPKPFTTYAFKEQSIFVFQMSTIGFIISLPHKE